MCMRVAITGGTGFFGAHLAKVLVDNGHEVVTISRGKSPVPDWMEHNSRIDIIHSQINDYHALSEAFDGCSGVVHLAGINYERGDQTFEAIHRQGTETVCTAAEEAGVDHLLLSSYLRARPGTRSGYLDSKWDAEQRCRSAALPTTILKPAGIFGAGDQFITQLARWLARLPIAPRLANRPTRLRPVAVEDVVRVTVHALTTRSLIDETIPLLGPETVRLTELVDRIGTAIERSVRTVPMPVSLLKPHAWAFERLLEPPLLTRAGLDMLVEEMIEPAPAAEYLELTGLAPSQEPSIDYLSAALSEIEPFGLGDLRRP